MMGSGGMVVMDDTSCMVAIAKFYLEFTCEESCGKCSPCRIGNKRMLEILTKITEGRGTMDDLQELRNLAAVIKDTARFRPSTTSGTSMLSTLLTRNAALASARSSCVMKSTRKSALAVALVRRTAPPRPSRRPTTSLPATSCLR